jgi:hypothetical protein
MTRLLFWIHPSRSRRPAALTAAVLATLVLALAGCGSSSSGSNSGSGSAAPSSQSTTTGGVSFAKTKFVLHAGLAFGAFHHWIWKPFRAGDFQHPFSHKLTLIKAGLAAAFTYHELKLALHDAQADPTLSKLVAPITALENRLHGVPAALKSGSTASLGQDNGAIAAFKSQSASAGQRIQEQLPSSP